MIDGIKEECAVAAIMLRRPVSEYHAGGVAYYLYHMLLQMQNRGQLSSGITTYNRNRSLLLDSRKKLGLVEELFSANFKPKMDAIFSRYSGSAGIGHNRYSTFGGDDVGCAQPFERQHGRKWKWFSFAFNGNIANFSEIKRELESKHYHLVRNLDTEVLQHLLEKSQLDDKRKPLQDVFRDLAKKVDGAYGLVYIDAEGTLAAARDIFGIRPMCYAVDDDFVVVASESSAINYVTDAEVKSLGAGEILIASGNKVEVRRYANSPRNAHCIFEWVYFSNPTSVIDGASVYQARWNCGLKLARGETLAISDNDFVVVSVPDTSRPVADAYSYWLKVPQMEGLIKNRYLGRTFIAHCGRTEKVEQKYNINASVLRGKKVILIDDSIVRGTTLGSLIKHMREKAGVKEIHLRIACPPIRSPCFYGVDMSKIGELLVNRHCSEREMSSFEFVDIGDETLKKMADLVGADSLRYITIEGLTGAIGKNVGEFCTACLNGKYPTKWGNSLKIKAFENYKKMDEVKRTYE